MTPFPWEGFRKIIVSMAQVPDDYVTIDGAGEAIVQPNFVGAALRWKVRISPRRSSTVGQGRAYKETALETINGKDYRVVTQSGHDAWYMDIVVESFDKETYAGDVSRELARAFEDEGHYAALCAIDLSVASVNQTADVRFVKEGQELSSAALEILVYHKWSRVDRTARELIETVVINGDQV